MMPPLELNILRHLILRILTSCESLDLSLLQKEAFLIKVKGLIESLGVIETMKHSLWLVGN